jgi:hypothetical protein
MALKKRGLAAGSEEALFEGVSDAPQCEGNSIRFAEAGARLAAGSGGPATTCRRERIARRRRARLLRNG